MKTIRPVTACALSFLLAGCEQQMGSSGAYKPMDPTPMFADGSSARPLPSGTVPRGQDQADLAYYTGVENGKLVTNPPRPVTAEMLARGQERFTIYCAMCHGRDGYGKGSIVQRGFTPPPSFHSDAARNAALGHYFDVITRGQGAMYSYASRVPVADRWAIAAYIRVLQLSQHAKPEDVPPNEKLADVPPESGGAK